MMSDAPISITKEASEHIQGIIKEESLEDHSLRIIVANGGCAGLQYGMDFTKDIVQDIDTNYEVSGIPVVIDNTILDYLVGTEIDFVDDLTGTGFKFNNPNAVRKCGCEKSFGCPL